MHLLAYGEKVKDADFLLFYLGWDERWGTKEYFGDYPCIDDSVLDHILCCKKQVFFFQRGTESGHITDGMKRLWLRCQTTSDTKYKL